MFELKCDQVLVCFVEESSSLVYFDRTTVQAVRQLDVAFPDEEEEGYGSSLFDVAVLIGTQRHFYRVREANLLYAVSHCLLEVHDCYDNLERLGLQVDDFNWPDAGEGITWHV